MKVGQLSLVSVGLLLASVLSVGASSGLQHNGILEQRFDDFLSASIPNFQENLKDPVATTDFLFNETTASSEVTGNITATRVWGAAGFNFSLESNITARTLSFELVFSPSSVIVNGNYGMDGLVNSLILIHGKGPFNQSLTKLEYLYNAKLFVDSNGYASIENISRGNSYSVETAFDGIEGIEIIGELIESFLINTGFAIFREVSESLQTQIDVPLINYLNEVLRTATLDEILGNENGSTTPNYSTTTGSPNPTTTGSTNPTTTGSPNPGEETIVVDIGPDLVNSGWTIPTTTSCGYSTQITGFFCNGLPVNINGRHNSTGFWMSPCFGACIFEYNRTGNDVITSLGFNAFYNDINTDSRIVVRVGHSDGIQQYVFTHGDGDSTTIGLNGFSNVQNITVSMENNGSGLFSVLDRLNLTKY